MDNIEKPIIESKLKPLLLVPISFIPLAIAAACLIPTFIENLILDSSIAMSDILVIILFVVFGYIVASMIKRSIAAWVIAIIIEVLFIIPSVFLLLFSTIDSVLALAIIAVTFLYSLILLTSTCITLNRIIHPKN